MDESRCRTKSGLVLLVAIAAALLAACGGGDGHTLEEYFDEVETLAQRYRAEVEPLRDPDWARDFETPELGELRAAIAGARHARARFVGAARELDPPAEAREEHRAVVEAGGRIVEAYDDWLTDTQDATTSKEIIDASGFYEAGQAESDFGRAWQALRELADANGITIDLGAG